jgi:hypothetical protein
VRWLGSVGSSRTALDRNNASLRPRPTRSAILWGIEGVPPPSPRSEAIGIPQESHLGPTASRQPASGRANVSKQGARGDGSEFQNLRGSRRGGAPTFPLLETAFSRNFLSCRFHA